MRDHVSSDPTDCVPHLGKLTVNFVFKNWIEHASLFGSECVLAHAHMYDAPYAACCLMMLVGWNDADCLLSLFFESSLARSSVPIMRDGC